MYSLVEQVILADYFGFPAPEYEEIKFWEEDPQNPSAIILEPDCWNDQDVMKAIPNAVARIALARVQRSLPQFAVAGEDGVEFGRAITFPTRRPVEMISRYLFTIDWAMTAPGVSWPEAYYLTWLPGVERWLVTSSRDTPEIGGYCDTALGYFESDKDPIEGAGVVIGGYWCDQMVDYDQQRWEMFFDAGLVNRSVAMSWADEVWNASEHNEDDDAIDAMEEI
jgi:hypothetical protein